MYIFYRLICLHVYKYADSPVLVFLRCINEYFECSFFSDIHFFGNLFTKVGFMVYFVEKSKPAGKPGFLFVACRACGE